MITSGIRILVLGGGGHGRMIADLIRTRGEVVAGFIDGDPEKLGDQIEPGGGRVLMLQDEFLRDPSQLNVDGVHIAIGHSHARQSLFEQLYGSVNLPVLVHPSAIISASAGIGDGTAVCAGVVVNALAQVGDAVILNTGCIVEHDCMVGFAAHIAPSAVLAGGVSIGPRSWIGVNATVLPRVRVGADVMVGAGAVVTRDVPDGVTVIGNPARILER